MKKDAYEAEEKSLPEHQEGNTIMKYYLTQTGREFIQEGEYTPDDEAAQARKRANTSDAAQSGKKPKMSGDFSDTPREGEERVQQLGVTLPKAKKKKKTKKVDEVKSAKDHGQDIENKEFDKGVYGFHSDLTGTIKGGQAKILRRKRLAKTRLRRWARAISRATDPFSDVGTGSPKIRGKVREGDAVKEAKRSPSDQEGDRASPKGDQALDTFYDLERLKFLKRSGRRKKK